MTFFGIHYVYLIVYSVLQSGRIGADEDIDDMEGKTMEEMEEIIKEKEAKAQATILEMVGDLPDGNFCSWFW